MEKLGFGLIVSLIGMLIVFFGLVVLIGLIKALVSATNNMGKKEKKQATAAIQEVAPAEAVQEAEEVDDGAVVAAITAALACVLGGDQTFTVKHIRRIAR